MSLKTELLMVGAVIVATLFAYLYFCAKMELRVVATRLAETELSLAEAVRHERDATAALAVQNAAIEKVMVDTVVLINKIKEVEIRYQTKRDTVIKSIERDGSCENQIGNIDAMLRVFGGR